MYRRRRTLFEHQQVACSVLGFSDMTEPQRRALVRALRHELDRTADRERLLLFIRRWAYEHRLIPGRERDLRSMIAAASRQHEKLLAQMLQETVDPLLLANWQAAIGVQHDSGTSVQTWLWAVPAKLSARQIGKTVTRHQMLCDLGVDRHLSGVTRTCCCVGTPGALPHGRPQ